MAKFRYPIISILILLLLFSTTFTFAQKDVPLGFNYQAVARNDQGMPLANKEVVIEISLHKGFKQGQTVWQEVHHVTTDDFGIFSLVIGEGIRTNQSTAVQFSDIDWSVDDFFIRVRVDFGDEEFINGLVEMGEPAKLLSVPYSLIADSALNVNIESLNDIFDVNTTGASNNDGLKWDGSEWITGKHFLAIDGSTDLTGDWSISKNITSSAHITLTNGNLIVQNGSVNTNRIQMGSDYVTRISTKRNLGKSTPSDRALTTQKAVKYYIDSTNTDIIDYINDALSDAWIADNVNQYLYNTTKSIGIGTSTPKTRFHADVKKTGFLVEGNFDTGEDIGNWGAGSRMVFFPSKAAFRAGYLDAGASDYWDDSNVGLYSVAFGRNTRANINHSFAMGLNNTASGTSSSVFGENTTVGGIASFSSGGNNIVDGDYAVALGKGLQVDSYAEVVIGTYNKIKFTPGPDPTGIQAEDFAFVVGNGTNSGNRSNALSILKNGNTGLSTNQPHSTLQVEGSQARKINLFDAEDYPSGITLDATHNVVVIDVGYQTTNLELPPAENHKGRVYIIKVINATAPGHQLHIQGNDDNAVQDKIDEVNVQTLDNDNEFIKIISNGKETGKSYGSWYIIGQYIY